MKCIDEIAVESEKLRVNPFSDLMSKIFGFSKNSYPGGHPKALPPKYEYEGGRLFDQLQRHY